MRTLETQRLLLRSWTMEDVDAAFNIYRNPEVTRFLGNGAPVADLETQRARLQKSVSAYRLADPWNYWAAVDRETGTVIGAGLLKPLPGDERIEVGWHLGRDHWGKGFATEIGGELMRYGFEECGLETIFCVIVRENIKSRNVAGRLGLSFVESTRRYYDRPLDFFELSRVRWHETR